MVRSCWHRVSAALLLFCWIAGLVAPLDVSAHADRDIACSEPAWATLHQGQALSADRAALTDDEHCGLCHLQRAMRDVAGADSRVIVPAPVNAPVTDNALRLARVSRGRGEPSRAPPAVAL
jgi:hypothetical protein